MYLIKCAKCNNLIEVKTEYLMLCPHCKSKLENNYQEWRQLKENKGKNFQIYQREVCISEEELEEQQRQEKLSAMYSPKKNKIRRIANIAFSVIVIVAAVVTAIRLGKLTGEGWMRNYLLGINIGIGVAGAAGATAYALMRKKFQDFLPIIIGLGTIALFVLVDMAFFIITDNL